MLKFNTLLIMLSALVAAVLCILPATRDMFPFWLMARGLHVADTLFHEMGHTIFSWLFGIPTIPMIFTFFGADQAGGLSLSLYGRLWSLQIAAFAVLAYGCYWSWKYWRGLFYPAVLFFLFIAACAFADDYYEVVILYMGHGGSIAMGAFFLFRAWLKLDARNGYERWLNALFGFFLILYNMYFAYTLVFDLFARTEYDGHVAFGISHNDFKAIEEKIFIVSETGIALFTMAYGLVAIVGTSLLALYLKRKLGKRLLW